MDLLLEFEACLLNEEKSRLTVEKYLRDVRRFLTWMGKRPVSKREVVSYKELLAESYEVTSVNSMLSSINHYLEFTGRPDCRVKTIRRQRKAFLPEEKELSRTEYDRLVRAAAAEVVHGAECVGCPYDKVCPKCPAMRLSGLYTGHCNPEICEMTRKLVAAGVKKIPDHQ